LILSVPGKTFLLGEYVALDGGPSLLLSTGPRFQLSVRPRVSDQDAPPFHPQSPAGLYFAQNEDDLKQWHFEFRDPYHGKGGLGASSAQFALLYAFQHGWEWRGAHDFPWTSLLKDYRACAWSGEGVPPSGADVVSQLTGGVTWFDGRAIQAERLNWPFSGMAFTLIRTGHKVATHEHLKSDAGLAPHSVLRTIVIEARKAFESQDEIRLIESVNACSLALRQSGLTTAATTDLLDQMRDNHELFWAAKGCGAMGADVIIALHAVDREADIVRWAKGRGLEVCGSLTSLSSGIETLQEGRP
jgi:mevalonate kinase